MYRQSSPVAETSITADIHEPFDVLAHLSTEIPLHTVVRINELTYPHHFRFGEIFDSGTGINLCLTKDHTTTARSNAIDISQSNINPLVSW